jgi:hypothetical protein
MGVYLLPVCGNRHDGMNEYEARKTLAWHIRTADHYWETNDETLLQIMKGRVPIS